MQLYIQSQHPVAGQLLLANPKPIIVHLNFSQPIAYVVELGRLDQLNFLLSVFY
ncbi:hypothetical protein M595_2676 [Lyngbya aestuarii BL J]|uniref:Uncharacterized protein n=1 Tax=Lyngbya aestuarii BL J TaxID=1348334 RepID=U7QHL5_9CYAN|nr:hypothetical protein M595_2676 [Lyngbya aestuarii BL J]